MDEDAQNAMTFAQNDEWDKLVEEMSPYIESSSIGMLFGLKSLLFN